VGGWAAWARARAGARGRSVVAPLLAEQPVGSVRPCEIRWRDWLAWGIDGPAPISRHQPTLALVPGLGLSSRDRPEGPNAGSCMKHYDPQRGRATASSSLGRLPCTEPSATPSEKATPCISGRPKASRSTYIEPVGIDEGIDGRLEQGTSSVTSRRAGVHAPSSQSEVHAGIHPETAQAALIGKRGGPRPTCLSRSRPPSGADAKTSPVMPDPARPLPSPPPRPNTQ
jgi:hypothetical protein